MSIRRNWVDTYFFSLLFLSFFSLDQQIPIKSSQNYANSFCFFSFFFSPPHDYLNQFIDELGTTMTEKTTIDEKEGTNARDDTKRDE